MTDGHQGYKGGLRGAQMFRRRVDQLFDVIDQARPDDDFTGWGNKDVFHNDLVRFKGIDATGYFNLHDDDLRISTDSTLDDTGAPRIWPFRHTVLVPGKDVESDGFGENALQCRMMRSVTMDAARGKARIFSKHMIASDTLVIHKLRGNWRFVAANHYYALVSRSWVDASWWRRTHNGWKNGIELAPKLIIPHALEVNRLSQEINLSMSWSEARKAQWHVEIGRRSGLSFSFATLASRVSGIFKAREIKDGEKRRAALKNWVTDHWRTDAGDPDFEIYVRRHLRGSETFEWGDYFCTVHPSITDLEDAEAAKIEREAMGDQARRLKFAEPAEKPRYRVRALSRAI